MIYSYPPEIHEFVKKWSPVYRDDMLAKECNRIFGTDFTAAKMKSFRGNHGYRNGQKRWTSEEYWKYQTRYPQGMYEFIRDNSWNVSSKDMAEMVNQKFGTNFTATGMKQFRQRNKIKSGLTGWYQRGHEPGNKGKKWEDYIPPERLEEVRKAAAPTQFKKGQKPPNELPIGAIVINSYGYKLRKKQMTGTLWERWEFLHRAVWEEHNGPIPEGMVVSFRDSNKLNCDISNLMLITKGENAAMSRKHYRSENPELTDAGLAITRLSITAEKLRKKRREA